MQNEKIDPGGIPAAIAALGLTPGASTTRSAPVCPKNAEHNVLEAILIAWNPVFQRHEIESSTERCKCFTCSGRIERKSLPYENARTIRCFLEKIDDDCRELERLLKGKGRNPWKRHVCLRCGSEKIQGKGCSFHDLYQFRHEILSFWSGANHEKGLCHSCLARSSQMVAMTNHERLIAAGRMHDELARLTAQRAEIDGWLAVHGHIYGWAPPG